MLIPGQNRLADPAIVDVPPFEQMLATFKAVTIAHVAESDPAMAEKVRATLESEPEVFTKLVEVATVMLQTERRHRNEQIKQMLAWWSEGSNLDAKVADLGLQRQVISEGDPDAYPPVPPVQEDDERLRMRYFLAPYSFSNAGPRLAYRFHALTLSARPQIEVDAPEEGVVVVTYRLPDTTLAGKVKDAVGKRTAPGKVRVAVLSRDGDGTPSAELLQEQREYFARDDVAPATDEVTVTASDIVKWRCQAVIYINRGPDPGVVRDQALKNVQRYANEQHRIEGFIERSALGTELHNAGAERIDIQYPATSLAAVDFTAPYCTGIDIEVRQL